MTEKSTNFMRSISRVALGRSDVLLASFGINVLTLALPLVILQIYDRIIPNKAQDTFVIMIIGLIAVVLIDFLLRVVRSKITTWSSARFEHATGGRAIDRLLSSKMEQFEADAPGTHLDRLAAIEALRDFHSGQSLITLSDLPFVVLFLLLVAIIGGSLVLAPLVIGTAALLFAIILAKKLDHAVLRRTELDNDRYNFVFQILNGVHSVKGLGLEAQMCRQYESIHSNIARAVQDLTFYSSIAQSVGSMFGSLTMVVVAILGSVLVLQGDLSNGALVASMLLAGRAIQPLLRMIGIWVQTRNLRLAEQRLGALMAMEQETTPDAEVDETPDISGWVKFEGVTVHRPNQPYPVLDDITLEIQPGETIALVGDTGSGRGVLLDLLCGLATPTEGRIQFDDVDGKNINFHKLREKIAYVRQFAVLYQGTLIDNLTGFRGRQRLATALGIAEKLGLDRMIASLPAGLQTRVGDAASETLPGSVQQMIALTRALAARPRVLLFDEANSAFDMETDQRLRALLKEMRGRITIVMITGRPSLIKIADRVITIDNGRVTGEQKGIHHG